MIGWHIYTDPERDPFVVSREHVLVVARNREDAKRLAEPILHHNKDQYICTPLTPGDEPITVMIPEMNNGIAPWRMKYNSYDKG